MISLTYYCKIILAVGMVHIIWEFMVMPIILVYYVPQLAASKEMLKTCETFAKQHDILFNASKSPLLWFGKGNKTNTY